MIKTKNIEHGNAYGATWYKKAKLVFYLNYDHSY